MGKKTPQPPPAPDPVAIANAQGAANTNSAIASQILNQTGQNTPYGSVSYNQSGSYTLPDGTVVPQFTQNQTLSPNQQQILSQTEGLQQQALGAGGQAINNVSATIGQPFNLAGAPPLQSSVWRGGPVKGTSSASQPYAAPTSSAGLMGPAVPPTGGESAAPMPTDTSGRLERQVGRNARMDARNARRAGMGGITGDNGVSPGSGTPFGITNTFQNPQQQMSLGINDFSADRQNVQDALMSRFNQDWDKQSEATKANLNAQGIQSGSEGYGVEMDQLSRARNDALTQAILGAGTEQSRLFDMTRQSGEFANNAAAQQFGQNQSQAAFGNAASGQLFGEGLAQAQFGNQARAQAVSEAALQRSQPINEFATLFGLGGGVQVPTGAQQSGVGVNPADILGANALQYNALNSNYQTQMANRNSVLGSLGNIAGMLGGGYLAGR